MLSSRFRFPWRCDPGPRRVHGRYHPFDHPQRQGPGPRERHSLPARVRARGTQTEINNQQSALFFSFGDSTLVYGNSDHVGSTTLEAKQVVVMVRRSDWNYFVSFVGGGLKNGSFFFLRFSSGEYKNNIWFQLAESTATYLPTLRFHIAISADFRGRVTLVIGRERCSRSTSGMAPEQRVTDLQLKITSGLSAQKHRCESIWWKGIRYLSMHLETCGDFEYTPAMKGAPRSVSRNM